MTPMEKRPHQADPGYLHWLRLQRCACGCLKGPPCDAAHLRVSSLAYDKPLTGMSQKPDDRWALPLWHAHHMSQHGFRGGELGWWAAHGVPDPFALCIEYHQRYLKSWSNSDADLHPRDRVRRG